MSIESVYRVDGEQIVEDIVSAIMLADTISNERDHTVKIERGTLFTGHDEYTWVTVSSGGVAKPEPLTEHGEMLNKGIPTARRP